MASRATRLNPGPLDGEIMTRRSVKLVAAFTCIHAVLAIACLLYSFSASMDRFDNGGNEGILEVITAKLAQILVLPASLVWTRWASERLPNVIEWLTFAANSVVWGMVATLLLAIVTRRTATVTP